MTTIVGSLEAVLGLDPSGLRKGYSRAKKETKSFETTLTKSFKRIGAGFVAMISIRAVKDMGTALFTASKNMTVVNLAFNEITGSSQEARRELDFLRQVSDDMGQSFYTLLDPYKKILAASKGTALEGDKLKNVFTGVIKAAATLGLSSDQVEGSLRAMEQMISKGNVQAEELRGQLGERLPGAFRLAAEAMGKTTQELNKMLDNGEVLASELLPKLGDLLNKKYSGNVSKAVRASNKLREAWEDMKVSMGSGEFIDAIGDSMMEVANIFKDPEFQSAMKDFTNAFATAVRLSTKLLSITSSMTKFINENFNINKAYKEYAKAYEDMLMSFSGINPRSQIVFGGYADSDAIEAAFNNQTITLRPEFDFKGVDEVLDREFAKLDEAQGERWISYVLGEIEESVDSALENFFETLDFDKVDEALNEFFAEMDSQSKEISIDIELDSFFRDLDEAEEEIKKFNKSMTTLSEHTADAMQDSFADFFISIKDGFADLEHVVTNFLNAVYNALAQYMAQQMTSSIFSSIGLEGRASGGIVNAGQAYIVGENGPEILQMGGQAGYIHSNNASIGGDVIINVNNNSKEKVDVRQSRSADGTRAIFMTIGDEITNGGHISSAIERRYGLTPQGRRA